MRIQRWNMVNEIGNQISTLFQRQKSNVDPICIFNPLSTSIQRLEDQFQFRRWFNIAWINVVLPAAIIHHLKDKYILS